MIQVNDFRKGLSNVRVKDLHEVKTELMETLGITSRVAFQQRADGRVNHTPAERLGIEFVFGKFGVAKQDVWGK